MQQRMIDFIDACWLSANPRTSACLIFRKNSKFWAQNGWANLKLGRPEATGANYGRPGYTDDRNLYGFLAVLKTCTDRSKFNFWWKKCIFWSQFDHKNHIRLGYGIWKEIWKTDRYQKERFWVVIFVKISKIAIMGQVHQFMSRMSFSSYFSKSQK